MRNDGDADAAISSATKKVDVVYEFPFAAHATMEPMNCTVHIRPDGAEAWVPTQAPQWAQDVIAGVSGLPRDSVIVHTTLMGGGFGRRYMGDFVMEAAQVAKVTHKPIMVLWTREDDMQHDFYRPASYHHLSGAVDTNGNLAAWKHFQTSTSIDAMWSPKGKETPENSEFATAIFIPYHTPNYRIEYTVAQSAVPRAWWRSVEHSTSGFVVESFVDELAAAAGADPLAFRLRLIGDDRTIPDFSNPKEGKPLVTSRLKGVLNLAAHQAPWGKPLPKGHAQGIATYYSFESYTACVAEVSVENRAIKVHRLVYAVDCGRPINPNGVAAQVEGAAIYGLSAALYDAITIRDGRVEQSNFNDYAMPRIAATPKTEVYVVPSNEEPTGIGEPGLPVVVPAICNAVFAATGKRLRRFPIRDHQINIVDTPGHADFGGEVERILSMVDSVLLLVDAVDGPMPQTRFVTQKAFARGLKPIVVINKIDSPGARRSLGDGSVFDLFLDNLGATETQLDFPVVYASALNGYAKLDLDTKATDMGALLQTIVDRVAPPDVDGKALSKCKSSSLGLLIICRNNRYRSS